MIAEELDEIFNLDINDEGHKSMYVASSEPPSDQEDDVDEHFEFDRKNHAEEDAQVAQTIIMGIEEYTEFKVAPPGAKEAGKIAVMQYELNKKLVRLCIIRCFHPDKLMQEIRSFIMHFLDQGEKFIEVPQFNFKHFIKTLTKK